MFSRAWLKSKHAIKFLPRSAVFQLVTFVLNYISSCVLPSEFFPQILKGTNCPLGRFLKGQFQYQCGIGAVAWPGSNPVVHVYLYHLPHYWFTVLYMYAYMNSSLKNQIKIILVKDGAYYMYFKGIFAQFTEYVEKGDLNKCSWNPKRKLGVTTHFSKIIHQQHL